MAIKALGSSSTAGSERLAWSVLMAAMLLGGAVHCGGGAQTKPAQAVVATGGGDTGAPGDRSLAPVGASALLAEASAAMSRGQLPGELRERVLASTDPALARARRIFAVMGRRTSTEDAASQPGPGAGPTSGEGAPRLDPVARPGPEALDKSTEGRQYGVMTRLSLTKEGPGVALLIHGSGTFEIGTAEKPASSKVTLVVKSAGALPAAMQARHELEGVAIIGVTQGDDTVLVTVRYPAGWRPLEPERTRSGGRVGFAPR